MKARIISTVKPAALLFGLESGYLWEKLTTFLNEKSIEIIYIRNVSLTLEEIISGGEVSADNDGAFDFPCIILNGIECGALQKLLRDLEGIDVQRQVLKAVVTPTNRTWTVENLLIELQKEHALMNAKT